MFQTLKGFYQSIMPGEELNNNSLQALRLGLFVDGKTKSDTGEAILNGAAFTHKEKQ